MAPSRATIPIFQNSPAGVHRLPARIRGDDREAAAPRPVADRRPRSHWLVSFVALALTVCSAGDSAEEGVVSMRFGHVGEPGSLFALAAEEFARRANARLDGYEVVVFGSSQLGADELVLQKIRLGTAEFGLPSTVMSSQIDEFGIFEMPYLVRDREHMRAIERDVVWPDLAPLAEERGYRILAVWENGYRHVTNNIRPIETPSDLEGLKLRTPRGIWRVRLFQSLGSNPTPMPLSEVFIGLQTGVIDGQENPLPQIWASKLHEVQDYLTLTRHVYTPAFVVVSPQWWDALPEETRNVLQEEARATQDFVHETAERLDEELLGLLANSGLTVNAPDLASFREAAGPIRASFAETVPTGEELLRKAEEAVSVPSGGESAGSG